MAKYVDEARILIGLGVSRVGHVSAFDTDVYLYHFLRLLYVWASMFVLHESVETKCYRHTQKEFLVAKISYRVTESCP